jgi:uncharacterized DUF497 family protein
VTTVRFVAGEVTFEWDATKAATNKRKHGVSFEEAATAFLDPLARIFNDPDHGHGELRFLLVGTSAMNRMVIVVHVERGESLRIISARLASGRERSNLESEV